MVKVLFVCLGNICRSPLAEGVFRAMVEDAGLGEHFSIDSAGTGSWHIGDPPDSRMIETARKNQIDLTGLRGRQFSRKDYGEFDYILAMDQSNLATITQRAPSTETGSTVALFRTFDPIPGDYAVPDPYYGGPSGFDVVFEIVSRTSARLLHELIELHGLEGSLRDKEQ